ncbi:MAG: hypothetical protein RL391_464 [Actinomycetota bacterium]|jgi:23S rRNA (uracil1939-C5)-methyltransferase
MADDEISVRIEKVVAEGDGLARLPDGRVVFVVGGLPGERLAVRVIKQSKDYARAEIEEILESHPERVVPPCPYVAEGCGGCDLQHASTALQRRIKHDIVVESLIRIGKVNDPIVTDCPDELPKQSSRTSMRWALDEDGRLGFRESRSHRVVPIDRCLVAHSSIVELRRGIEPVPMSGIEEVSLRTGVASGERAVWWEPSDVPFGRVPGGVALGAKGAVHEVVEGHRFRVSSASFFQASAEGATALVRAVRRAAGDPSAWSVDPVIDLYGGVGLFAATVVPVDHAVVLVESNRSACADAKSNLSRHRAVVVCSEVARWKPVEASLVIADPARPGLGASSVAVIAATRAPVVVLVSCDPASLGRDVGLLREAGYRLEGSEVLDLFPHTHHVEVVSRFVRDGRLSP